MKSMLRMFAAMLACVMLISCLGLGASAEVINWGEAVKITRKGQVVDTITHKGVSVDAIYRPYTSDMGGDDTYSCAAFVHRFYAKVFGAAVSWLYATNVRGTTTQSLPQVDKGSFTKTEWPVVGDIYRSSGHWAIVKAVDGDTITLIEQNCWLKNRTCAAFERKVTRTDKGDAWYAFFHYSENTPEPVEYTVTCRPNLSQHNYLFDSDFSSDYNANNWKTRDEKTATIQREPLMHFDGHGVLRIVNTAPGSSGKDLSICTMTQGRTADGCVGDNKQMVLSFWAKSAEPGAVMYFRWGYESTSNYRSVTLTDDWAYYTVRMDKKPGMNNYIHPYVDREGVVWISGMQLEDGTAPTEFRPECADNVRYTVRSDGSYQLLDGQAVIDKLPGFGNVVFDGWFTSKVGGIQITNTTPVMGGSLELYAHWHIQKAQEDPESENTDVPEDDQDTDVPDDSQNVTVQRNHAWLDNRAYDCTEPPSTLRRGSAYSIAGTIYADCVIRAVAIRVTDTDGREMFCASGSGSGDTFPMHSLDADVTFSKLPAGNYLYTVTVETDYGTETLISRYFSVADADFSASGMVYPNGTLKKGGTFSVKGMVTAGAGLRSVRLAVYQQSGELMFYGSTNPGSKSFNVHDLDSQMTFRKLPAGDYVYYVEVEDNNGVTWYPITLSFAVR